jgi:hypothetical protein
VGNKRKRKIRKRNEDIYMHEHDYALTNMYLGKTQNEVTKAWPLYVPINTHTIAHIWIKT